MLKSIFMFFLLAICTTAGYAQNNSNLRRFSLDLTIAEAEALLSMTEREAKAQEVLAALLTLRCDTTILGSAISPIHPTYFLLVEGTTRRDEHILLELASKKPVRTVDSTSIVLVAVLERAEAQRGAHVISVDGTSTAILTDLYYGGSRPEFLMTSHSAPNSGLVLRVYVHRVAKSGTLEVQFEPGEFEGESKSFASIGISPALVSQPESSFVIADSSAALDPDAPHEVATYGRAIISLHAPRGRVYYERPFWQKSLLNWYKHVSFEAGVGFLLNDYYLGGAFNVYGKLDVSIGVAFIDRPNSTDERRLESLGHKHLIETLPDVKQENIYVGITFPLWIF